MPDSRSPSAPPLRGEADALASPRPAQPGQSLAYGIVAILMILLTGVSASHILYGSYLLALPE
ncbi:hypothetical protein [Belnapia sp. F-4-1]|uniref:hypothetical protein n=1 Tax=Belnapia sp. F-4-1 TaxID=1545443 RepID=UPI001364DCB9|nr:hypothetical protein [Belnapia sp. F-4-1]